MIVRRNVAATPLDRRAGYDGARAKLYNFQPPGFNQLVAGAARNAQMVAARFVERERAIFEGNRL
jgi:hypothetical protein